MPFFTDYAEPGVRVPTPVAPPDPLAVPTPAQTVVPALVMQNPVVSLARRLMEEQYPSDPGGLDPLGPHNPLDLVKGTRYENEHLDRFVASRSPGETRTIMRRIDEEEANQRLLDAAGGHGMIAQLGAGLLDPTIFLPVGAIYRSAKGGYSIARSAVSVGTAGLLQSTASEAILRSTQETRGLGEVAFNVGTATVLSALLGAGAAKLLSRAERGSMEQVLDGVRAEMDAHAGNVVRMPERIRTAAVRVEGEVFTGGNHLAAVEAAAEARGVKVDDILDHWIARDPANDGWVTTTGRFVDRAEAAEIAKRADQIGGMPLIAEKGLGIENLKLDTTPPPARAAAAGAAATDTRTLDLETHGLEKVPIVGRGVGIVPGASVTRRVLEAEAISARRNLADLAETPYRFKNDEVPTQGPALDRMVRMEINGTRVAVSDKIHELFSEMRFGGPARLAGMRGDVERLMGREGMTIGEFRREISRALQEGDQHEIPQVAAAAGFIRKRVFEPWKERAQKAGLLPEDIAPNTAESYFMRVYNKQAIAARRPEFVNKVADWLKQDQAAKAEIKERLDWGAAQLRSWEQQITRLQGRAERLQARQSDIASRLDERAMEVSRTERRAGALEDRAATLSEEIVELEEFIKGMREEVRDPYLLGRIDQLEREAALLRKADKPMTEAQLRKVEEEERKGILTGSDRMAAEILTGRRAPPEVTGLLKWIEREGGIRDTEGHIGPLLDDPKLRKRLIVETKGQADARKGQGTMAVGDVDASRKGMTLDQLAQRIDDEVGLGAPTRDELLEMIADAQGGKEPEWIFARLNERQKEMLQANETAAMLDELFTRAGIEVKSVRDVAEALRGERIGRGGAHVTTADLDKILADMEAVGQAVPVSVQRAGAEEKVSVARETISNMRAMIERSKVAAASKEKARRIAAERGDEALIAERANRGRLGILQDRFSRADLKDDMLAEALLIAARERDAVRAKIEADIGSWQGTSASEAKTALKAREAYAAQAQRDPDAPRLTSADSAVDSTVERILKSERDLDDETLRGRSQEITDRILSSPDGRLPYDVHSGGPEIGWSGAGGERPRGPLAARDFAIPDATIREFLEDDAELVASLYMRTMAPDVLLTERFGDTRMTAAFRSINDEYAALVDAAPNQKKRVELEKERQAVTRDMAAIRDRVRHVYGFSPDLRNAARVAAGAKAVNNLTSMGMAAISSIPDFAGAVFRHGFSSAVGDGWVPMFNMLRNPELFDKFKEQWRAVGIGIETTINARQHALDDVMDVYRPENRFERGLQAASDKFFIGNLLAPLTDFQKNVAANVAVSEILRASEAVTKGKATKAQLANLAESGINPQMAGRIWEGFQNGGGEVIDRVRLPNTADWTDKEAARALTGAVARDVDIMVVTPGAEKPLWMSHPVFSVMGQFRAFTSAATERILIANLQRRDSNTMQGLIFSLGLGMLSYRLNALFGGQPVSDRPQDWFKEAVSRSGLIGWFEEGNALAAKASRGSLDIYRMIGADKPLSRFASRSALDMFLGPTAGKLESMLKVTGGAASMDWQESDTKALRRLTAMQNLFYVRRGFDALERGFNNSFGIEMKATAQ